MIRSRSPVIGILLAVVGLTALAGPVPAAPGMTVAVWSIGSPDAAEEEIGRMQLVLDSSGSMSEPAAGGQTKIAAAKRALSDIVDGLPDQAQVGLRVYGAEVFSRNDPGACTDSQQVVAPGTDNRDELRAAIAGYRPYGETPIGYALSEAAKDLGGEGHRTIVLVSDGEATCPPSPCVVARRLAEDGIELRIDVVGLDVSGQARRQLACIADAGRGEYYDADSADDLVRALDRTSARALRPFQLAGAPIDGGDTEQEAAQITAGKYVDTLGGAGSENWYRIRRELPGSSLWIGVAGKTAAGTEEERIELLTRPADPMAETDSCGETEMFDNSWADSMLFGLDLVIDPRAPGQHYEDCQRGDLLVTLRRAETADSPAGQVELLVVEEPPVQDVDDLPSPQWDTEWQEPATTASPTPILGGASFDGAQIVEPGSYTGDIVPGETQVFALDVGWGDTPVFDVQIPRREGALEEAVGAYEVDVRARLFTPMRGQFDYSLGPPAPGQTEPLADWRPVHVGSIGPQVRYRNRESGQPHLQSASIPGTYYLVVEMSDDPGGDNYALPFTMRVARISFPEGAAAPEYTGTDAASPESPPTAAETADDGDDGTSSPDARDDSEDGLGSVRLAAGVAAAALGVAALALAGLLLLRRRPR